MAKEKKKKEEKKDELEILLQRVQADFINYKNRVQSERSDFLKMAKKDLILEIIPVLDNFSRAFHNIPEEIEENDWVQGVNHIQKQIEEVLRSEGLEKININEAFDYEKHEAIGFEDSKDKKDGEIIRELECGYLLNGKIIRPAKVVIVRRQDSTNKK